MVCLTILFLGIELFAPNFSFIFVLVAILPLIGCGILVLIVTKNMDVVSLRLATKSDANEIHDLMQEVYDGLDNKSLYVCDDLMYVKSI